MHICGGRTVPFPSIELLSGYDTSAKGHCAMCICRLRRYIWRMDYGQREEHGMGALLKMKFVPFYVMRVSRKGFERPVTEFASLK